MPLELLDAVNYVNYRGSVEFVLTSNSSNSKLEQMTKLESFLLTHDDTFKSGEFRNKGL